MSNLDMLPMACNAIIFNSNIEIFQLYQRSFHMGETVNRKWCLARRPEGLINVSDFEWIEETMPQLGSNEVLVRSIYLSLDPANRG